MRGRPGGCRVHRAALLDFVDRRELGPGTPAALEHLDHCHYCRTELAATVLTIHAVRRLLAEARALEPPGDAWERLRAKVQRPVGSAWQARSALAGMVVGAGLVAALVGPSVAWRPRDLVEREPGPGPAALLARTGAEQRAEAAFLNRVRVGRAVLEPSLDIVPATVNWSGPDGLGRAEVAVAPDVPLGRAD